MNEELNVQSVSDKVIVKVMHPKKIKTSGGIIIPDSAEATVKPQLYGEVVSVGEEVKNINAGDIIMFHGNGGQAIVLDEFICKVLCYGEIYGVASRNVDKQEEIPEEEFIKIASVKKEKSNIVSLSK